MGDWRSDDYRERFEDWSTWAIAGLCIVAVLIFGVLLVGVSYLILWLSR